MEENDKTTEKFGSHIVQYPSDVSLCAGCTSCEIVCSLVHEGVVGPYYNRIFLERGTQSMISKLYTCQHCVDHPCYNKCPRKDQAMCLDENNIAYIDEEQCIGCGMCVKACVFEPSRINSIKSKDKTKKKAKKCDLCRTRPEGPACVEYCQVSCIGLSAQEEG